MKTIKKYSIILLTLVVIGACEQYNLPVIPAPSKGTADFTKTVVVGSSIMSGYMNGALYTDGQKVSIPAIIATQMKLAGGGEFYQPDINATVGDYVVTGLPSGTLGRLYLKNAAPPPNPACTTSGPAPSPKAPGNALTTAGGAAISFTGDKSKLNNFSAYGVVSFTAALAATSGPVGNPAYNPYFARFAANPSVDGATGSSMIADAAAALASNGTFFEFWIGLDDVYAYALNGGGDVGPYPTKQITPTATFNVKYPQALASMLSAKAGTKGVVFNVPNIKDLPYFTTVTWNNVVFLSCDPTSVATVNQLNSAGVYGGFNAALDGLAANAVITQAEANKRKVVFRHGTNSTTGSNAIVITDESLADLSVPLGNINAGLSIFGKVRQATSADLITLTAGTVLPTGVGVSPAAGFLGDIYVVLPSEQTEIQAAIDAYNATIAAQVTATSDRLVLVDAKEEFKKITAGTVLINGASLGSSIKPPFGGWSLDGVHLNGRGNGYIANLVISAVNAKWGSTVPLCSPNDYAANDLPVN